MLYFNKKLSQERKHEMNCNYPPKKEKKKRSMLELPCISLLPCFEGEDV